MPDHSAGPPQIVVFTGLPGTGKSTLAEALARTLKAPAFAGDWLMGALKPFGLLAALERSSYLDMHYHLLWTLVHRQLPSEQSQAGTKSAGTTSSACATSSRLCTPHT